MTYSAETLFMDIPNRRRHVIHKMGASLLSMLVAMSGLLLQVSTQVPQEITGEYCFLEEFRASCNGTDVIFMTQANYGRMKAGKCIKGEVGFLGCSKNILPYMDGECSGRATCSVSLLKLRDLFNACSKELLSYLDVSYICQPVSGGDEEDVKQCSELNEIRVDTSAGVLFSGTALSAVMGTEACPWFIQALPGQRIKFTLYTFTRGISSGANNGGACPVSLTVRDSTGVEQPIGLCKSSSRQYQVYTSMYNSVHVWFVFKEQLTETPYFLLAYEPVGCPDFQPPENMWVTVDMDIATVVCNFTGETWYLICRGTTWVGELGNCTKGKDPPGTNAAPSDFPWGILIAVGIGIAIGTVVGLALLGMVFLCRRCICPPKRKPPIPTHQPSLTARDVPPMNELIRSATVMAKQGDPRASQAYETRAQTHPYTTQKFTHQVEYHPQGPGAAREQEHVYESYIYKDGTIRSRKDSATESTGSGYCDMEGSSISDFPVGPPIRMQIPSHLNTVAPTTAHPVGGGELEK